MKRETEHETVTANAFRCPYSLKGACLLALYTLTIFVGASLLFLVQPMFARMALPLLGGSPAVWNTALVFYQAALLAGYAYAHFSATRLGVRRQAGLHVALLLLPFVVLPIHVSPHSVPPGGSNPVPWLLGLLTLTVGLPFFVVSASSPLLQKWFAATGHPAAQDPYFLSVASNLGSMLALLSYPTLLEPHLRLQQQSQLWTWLYLLYVLLMFSCAFMLWRSPTPAATNELTHERVDTPQPALTPLRRARWVLLAFVPSSLMLSMTSYVTGDIVAVPFLWVLPLALYLLTFSIVFAASPLLKPQMVARAVPLVLLPLAVAVTTRAIQPVALMIPLHLANFFLLAMLCHGQLAADRPAARLLTEFYLWMSVGGVLGGAFNALLAPLIFHTLVEYPLGLIVACLLLPWPHGEAWISRQRALDVALPLGLALVMAGLIIGLHIHVLPQTNINAGAQLAGASLLSAALAFGLPLLLCFSFSRRPLRFGLGVAAILWAGTFYRENGKRIIRVERSFFGIHRVTLDEAGRYHLMAHGGTVHGMQSVDPARAHEPLSYYFRTGPAGQLFAAFSGTPQRVAVIGLGAGALACYAQPGQQWMYYEIDPKVEQIARDAKCFTYLQESRVPMPVTLGDARLSLTQVPDGAYDLIVLDAYSSDAIPVHLITREALRLYLHKLTPHGLLLLHISNQYLDLEPVLGALARDASIACRVQTDTNVTSAEAVRGKMASQWAVMARNAHDLGPLNADARWHPARTRGGVPVWTDDFSSILSVFRWQ